MRAGPVRSLLSYHQGCIRAAIKCVEIVRFEKLLVDR